MKYDINRDKFSSNKILFEGCKEHSVNLDFNLPDYCPDIKKILKCQIYPQINSKNVVSDRLDIDGTAIVKLIYVDAIKNTIRCTDYKEPFSFSFNLETNVENAMSRTKIKVDYINCRAISSRRLDIHGAFSVCAKIFSKQDEEIVNNIESEDIQLKKQIKKISTVSGIANQQFSINETIEIEKGKSKIENIIRNDISLSIKDNKIVDNKVIVKADAFIKILYLNDIESGNTETTEYILPVSQIIDVPGINENDICITKIEILNSDIRTKSDGFNDENLLSVNLKLCATVVSYKEQDTEIIEDVYSTKYKIDIDYNKTCIQQLIETLSEVYTEKNIVEISTDGISKIIDVFNEFVNVNTKYENNKIIFKGKMNICILAIDDNEETIYVEKMVDFEHSKDYTSDQSNLNFDLDAAVLSINHRINSKNSLEVKMDIEIKTAIFKIENLNLIDNITANEEKHSYNDASLTIYYADEGENIWNIAKNYKTSVDAIRIQNELNEDIFKTSQMILIPM